MEGGPEAPLPEGKAVAITVVRGPDTGVKFELTAARIVIGRKKGDVLVRDRETSGLHASIEYLPDGRFVLKDLGSTNGTWLDGRRVTVAEIQPGQQLKIGANHLLFALVDSGTETTRQFAVEPVPPARLPEPAWPGAPASVVPNEGPPASPDAPWAEPGPFDEIAPAAMAGPLGPEPVPHLPPLGAPAEPALPPLGLPADPPFAAPPSAPAMPSAWPSPPPTLEAPAAWPSPATLAPPPHAPHPPPPAPALPPLGPPDQAALPAWPPPAPQLAPSPARAPEAPAARPAAPAPPRPAAAAGPPSETARSALPPLPPWPGAAPRPAPPVERSTMISPARPLPQAPPAAPASAEPAGLPAGVERSVYGLYLVVERGRDRGRVFAINRQVTVIGRSGTDILINDPDISRRHAALDVQGDGKYVIRDLNSTNGTLLNGVPLVAENVSPNDKIRMGATTIKLVVGDERLAAELARLHAEPGTHA